MGGERSRKIIVLRDMVGRWALGGILVRAVGERRQRHALVVGGRRRARRLDGADVVAGVVDFAPVARVDELRVAAARARSRCAFTLTLAEFCGNTGLLQRTISVASTHDLQSVYLVLHPKMLGPVKARAAVTTSWSIV